KRPLCGGINRQAQPQWPLMRLRLECVRAEFAVGHAGANFHPWMDRRDGPNNFSAIVCSDAVAAAQRRLGAKHAQNSFNLRKTALCVFHSAQRRRDETSMQIDKPIAPHEQLAGGTARLQGASDVNKTTLIIVDLVREASAQGFASGIDLLLCVTQSL